MVGLRLGVFSKHMWFIVYYYLSVFPTGYDRTNFFISGLLGVIMVIDPRKKIGHEGSSEVCKILGCLKCNYENCIFIRERLYSVVF